MSTSDTDRQIIHDEQAKRFILPVNGKQAFINYRVKEGVLHLTYAETPYELRGQGIGHELAEKTFQYLQDHNMKAVPICGFIRRVQRSSNAWDDVFS
ncbi:MAG: N-acetyltransferase [Flavobacteriales bacterium]|nr:N-acetyltransferase [Flavobacteriales bacterium]